MAHSVSSRETSLELAQVKAEKPENTSWLGGIPSAPPGWPGVKKTKPSVPAKLMRAEQVGREVLGRGARRTPGPARACLKHLPGSMTPTEKTCPLLGGAAGPRCVARCHTWHFTSEAVVSHALVVETIR